MSDDPTPATDDTGDALAYSDALAELEEILDHLEDDQVDVDVLAQQVGRAAELIRLCRGRIADARMSVEQIVAELEPDEDTNAD